MGPGGGGGEVLLAVFCCAGFVPLILAIVSVIIRGAVVLSNKVRGAKSGAPSRRRRYDDEYDDRDEERDERDRYDRYDDGGEVEPIPEPSFGWGMLIALVVMAVGFVVNLVVGIAVMGVAAANPQNAWVGQVISNGISIPAGFLIMSGIFTGMLPTTFPRALLVALMYHMIWLLIGLVIVVVMVGIMLATGGLR